MGFLDRLRGRFDWLDHAVSAYQRFDGRRGNFFAAGLSYYTIFAVFPLLMVGFAVVGFALSRRPELLNTLDDHIRAAVSHDLGQQLVDLMNSAIRARASVGVIGFAAAAWIGLSWMWHLREALSEMWQQPAKSVGFVRTKLSDALAMLWAFLMILSTIALTALGHAAPMGRVLGWLGVHDVPALDGILRSCSLVIAVLVSWLFFSWVIARLPRQPIKIATTVRAGLIAAIGFELFQQLGSIYLGIVVHSPAGAVFGPVLGLMVFVFVTAWLVLFATAWAATAPAASGGSRASKPRRPPARA